MSKANIEVLVDDLDGTVIMEGEGRTVPLSIDGRTVELDLTNDHIRELENSLSRFIGAAESGPISNGSQVRRQTSTATPASDLQVIREWARKNGFKVNNRGRIPFSVMDAFAKAHAGSARR